MTLLDLMTPGMNGWRFLAARRQDPALAAVPDVVLIAATDADDTRCRSPVAVSTSPPRESPPRGSRWRRWR